MFSKQRTQFLLQVWWHHVPPDCHLTPSVLSPLGGAVPPDLRPDPQLPERWRTYVWFSVTGEHIYLVPAGDSCQDVCVCSEFLYVESFLQTVKREWTGIDRLRMDKFFQVTTSPALWTPAAPVSSLASASASRFSFNFIKMLHLMLLFLKEHYGKFWFLISKCL